MLDLDLDLDLEKRKRRMAYLRMTGIAAAIFLAFLAGWYSTDFSQKGNTSGKMATGYEQKINNTNIPENKLNAEKNIAGKEEKGSRFNQVENEVKNQTAAVIPAYASFAPTTSIINNQTTLHKTGELVLFESEKDILDRLDENFKAVKKLAQWFKWTEKDSIKKDKPSLHIADLNSTKNIANNRIADRPIVFTNNQTVSSKGKWSLKAVFAPEFSKQGASGSNQSFATVGGSSLQETNSSNTYSGGMMTGYKVGKRIIIKSGLVFNNLKQTTKNLTLYSGNTLFASGGVVANTPSGQVSLTKTSSSSFESVLTSSAQLDFLNSASVNNQLKQDLQFVEIPLQATYIIIDKKINVGFTGGLSSNILIGNKASLIVNGSQASNGETAGMKSVVYSGSVGFEIGYDLSPRITLTIEPRYKHFINSLSTNKSVDFKPNQLGLITGLAYSFN